MDCADACIHFGNIQGHIKAITLVPFQNGQTHVQLMLIDSSFTTLTSLRRVVGSGGLSRHNYGHNLV